MNWFILNGTEQHGPFSLQKLTNLAATGKIYPTTFVWKQGMGGWKPAETVDELANIHFSHAAIPIPKKAANKPAWNWDWLMKPREMPIAIRVIGILLLVLVVLIGIAQVAMQRHDPLRNVPNAPPMNEQIKNEIKRGIELQMNVKVMSVELVRESSNKFTGFADTEHGKIGVEAVLDLDSNRWIWKTRGW